MANNAVAVECVAGRSPSALKTFVARRVLNNFVFAYSSEHCRGRSAAGRVYIDRRRDIPLHFANTLRLALGISEILTRPPGSVVWASYRLPSLPPAFRAGGGSKGLRPTLDQAWAFLRSNPPCEHAAQAEPG